MGLWTKGVVPANGLCGNNKPPPNYKGINKIKQKFICSLFSVCPVPGDHPRQMPWPQPWHSMSDRFDVVATLSTSINSWQERETGELYTPSWSPAHISLGKKWSPLCHALLHVGRECIMLEGISSQIICSLSSMPEVPDWVQFCSPKDFGEQNCNLGNSRSCYNGVIATGI